MELHRHRTFDDTMDPDIKFKGDDFLGLFAKGARQPPLTPEAFRTAIKDRRAAAATKGIHFFSAKDQAIVFHAYDKAWAG